MKRLLSILLTCFAAQSATYYVATTGSNSTGDGSVGNPWLTVQYAWAQCSPNDTILVQPGIYDSGSGGISSQAHGVTIRANGDATITNTHSGFYLTHSNCVVDGFVMDSITTAPRINACFVLGTNAHFTQIVNNRMQNNGTPSQNTHGVWMMTGDYGASAPRVYSPWQVGAQNCTFSNNFATNIYGGHVFSLAGSNNLVVANKIEHVQNGDHFMLHGVSNIVRGNYSTNCWQNTYEGGGGLHGDMFQTYQNTGETDAFAPFLESWGHVIENNQFWDCKIAIAQLEYVDSTDNANFENTEAYVGNWLFRNNLFVRSGSTNGSVSSMDIPGLNWVNNTFILCGTHADSSASPISLMLWSPDIHLKGTATNATLLNNAFIGCGRSADNGWFDLECHGIDTNLTGFKAIGNYVVHWNGSAWSQKSTHGHVIPGILGGNTYYTIAPVADINPGSSPNVADWTTMAFAGNARPMFGSPLIDTGTNVASYAWTDREGMSRPFGSDYDVGAFEYDPSLVMHLDFDSDFTSTPYYVPDVTGTGHHAFQMDATNRARRVEGKIGMAWEGYANGTMVNDPPQVYTKAQYAAITNVTGLDSLTSGTISVWVQWAVDAERWDTILDCGFAPIYSADPTQATNSWAWRYGSPNLSETPVGPTFKRFYTGDSHSTNGVMHTWTQPRDGITWWHLAVTWNASSNKFNSFENGALAASVDFGANELRISGSLDPKWLCLGAYQHDGTFTWGDDNYPNTGFFKGKMDDLRFYNRALSTDEIAALYSLGTGRPNNQIPNEPEHPSGSFKTGASGAMSFGGGVTVH